ncbi:MAG TPA: M23 family metallopeptidase [Candidatus Sulfotelmatobacter sp.]|nr:M23 family metallopeptidase [Candidatus Sulfotelmatobacter sp.]
MSNASANRTPVRDSREITRSLALLPARERAMLRAWDTIPCALHRAAHDLLRVARHPLIAACIVASGLIAAPARAEGPAPRSWFAKFTATPLAPPLTVTGGFGERRPRHFHAGLDLSTGGGVGRPVRAPLDGWIERLRTAGNGYGRAIYLHARDGRLVVLAHLDAFAPPLAAYVQSAQDSTARYEQDLWLERERFPVRAGQLLAWSGASGTGAPHLHIEIRRGDVSLNPQLAGLPVRIPLATQIRALTLEPLDGRSWVERAAGPLTISLALARAETLLVEGRVRAMVRADQPGDRGARLAPWRLRESWGSDWIEWRADSASWATDMDDVDYVYDVGRASPPGAPYIQMWSPRSWRPRVLRTNVADSLEAGVIEVANGAPPRPLRLEAEDTIGRKSSRTVWLRGPRPNEEGPLPHGTGRYEQAPARRQAAAPRASLPERAFELTGLPDDALRLSFRGAPESLREVTIAGRPATRRNRVWSVVLDRDSSGSRLERVIRGALGAGEAWADSGSSLELRRVGAAGARGALMDLRWRLDRDAVFEPATLGLAPAPRPAAGDLELVPIGEALEIEPASLPLRNAATIQLPSDEGWGARAGAYGDFGNGWEWLGGPQPSGGNGVAGDSRQLGEFAAFADTLAPRVEMLDVARHRAPGAYSTWGLRARVTENGSGVDGKESFFRVDGRRVPTEWDEPRDLLVWRPIAPPGAGTHRYLLEVRDHAGNLRRLEGSFVLD